MQNWSEVKEIAARTLHPEGWVSIFTFNATSRASRRRALCHEAEREGFQALIVVNEDTSKSVWVRLPR